MPRRNGKFIAPRRELTPKGKNHPLVCLYLVVELLYREWKANGEDWDETLSSLRVLRGESPTLREDFDEEGNKMTLNTMNRFILRVRDEWGAK